VSRVDGRPYLQYVRKEIFEPLEMRDTWLGMPREVHEQVAERVAPMHFATGFARPQPHRFPMWSASAEACAVCRPGGSARGPIHDLGRFYVAMLGGGAGVVRPQTVEAIAARHVVGMRDRTLGYPLDRGLGVVLDSKRYCLSASWYGNRCSPRTWGHAGYMSSVAFADPENRLAVALAFNGMLDGQEGRHDLRMTSVLDAVYADLNIAAMD
jgi:CubicO group peptidase (beta-lactamase class C family)